MIEHIKLTDKYLQIRVQQLAPDLYVTDEQTVGLNRKCFTCGHFFILGDAVSVAFTTVGHETLCSSCKDELLADSGMEQEWFGLGVIFPGQKALAIQAARQVGVTLRFGRRPGRDHMVDMFIDNAEAGKPGEFWGALRPLLTDARGKWGLVEEWLSMAHELYCDRDDLALPDAFSELMQAYDNWLETAAFDS